MKNPEGNKYLPKRAQGRSPTDLLERWDGIRPPDGELSKDRYQEGSNSETVRKHDAEAPEAERASAPVPTSDPKKPKTDPRKAPGETPELRGNRGWGNDNPLDDREDESQPGFNALEPDQK